MADRRKVNRPFSHPSLPPLEAPPVGPDRDLCAPLPILERPPEAPTAAKVPSFQVRKNAGKLQLATLVPLGALEAIARAAEVGLVKYRRDGFREAGGYSTSQCLDSAVRHIFAHTGGEKYDPDATALLGKPVAHLDQAIWNLSAAVECLRLYGERNDDCWNGPNIAAKKHDGGAENG